MEVYIINERDTKENTDWTNNVVGVYANEDLAKTKLTEFEAKAASDDIYYILYPFQVEE